MIASGIKEGAMRRWTILAFVMGTLILAASSAALAQGPDPCAGPDGASNPNCVDGDFNPNPCDTPAGANNPNCVDGEFKPDEPDDVVELTNVVTVDEPSSAAGEYQASGASFGPAPTLDGVSGPIVLANDGSAYPTEACGPLIGFPAGGIALVDRGTCPFVLKVSNAQNAGAVAVIVVQNVDGNVITMGGTEASITIPAVMISLADGDTIKAGLPATGTVRSN
jgi:hypothetical protein